MDSTDSKKKRKVDAERQRRTEINSRVEQIRHLLRLDDQLTRIQVLKKAADTTQELILGHSNVSPTAENTPSWCVEPRHLVHLGMTKALIEKHRRQLERLELNRIREILGGEQKSDISILDDVIRFIKPSHMLGSNNPTMKYTSRARRRPLQSIDTNVVKSIQDSMMTKHQQQQEEQQSQKKQWDVKEVIHSERGASLKFNQFWRPWET